MLLINATGRIRATAWLICLAATPLSRAGAAPGITVRAGIEARELVPTWYLGGGPSWCSRFASFAPNGRDFVVVYRRGDLRRNLNQYTMLLWKADDLGSERPRVILRMNSSSTRPAIDPSSISWAGDGRSITFLGEHEGGHHELFQLDLGTGQLRQLTDHPTSVISYSRDAAGDAIAYEALPPFVSLWDSKAIRSGLVVTTQYLPDLITGRRGYGYRGRPSESELFVQDSHHTREILPLGPGTYFRSDPSGEDNHGVSISPNGRYLVVLESVPVRQVPEQWRQYDTWQVQYLLSAMGKVGDAETRLMDSYLSRYVLVDVRSGGSRVLLNAPVIIPRRVLWAPDSRSVILSETLLPIRRRSSESERHQASVPTTIEVSTDTGTETQVGRQCHEAIGWSDGGGLVCDAEPGFWAADMERRAKHRRDSMTATRRGLCHGPATIQYQKVDSRWRPIGRALDPRLEVLVKEDMNSSPRLYLKAQGEKGDRMLWNVNPEFEDLKLGEVKEVQWNWSKGRQITAGLYYPPDYRVGRRYPLVIQTHGWDPDRFWLFGPGPTAFAAQPLAAHDIVVLQVQDYHFFERYVRNAQLKEVNVAIEIYQSAIRYLNNLGLIDPTRVGIIGWSHTCFYVKWALAHQPGLFAAATVSEGEDGGYLQYITGTNNYVDVPSLYGGAPVGRYLKTWVDLSPSFSLDQVRAPLWINVLNPRFLLEEWEWFDGLRDLGKPVEMVVLDHDEHFLAKPWDRLVSEGGNVDWFDFWLNGHEDLNPRKAQQYRRWEGLCRTERAVNPEVPTACVAFGDNSRNRVASPHLASYLARH